MSDGQAVSGGVGGHQRGVVHQHQHRRLQQLADAQGTFDADQRNARDHDAALVHRVDLHVATVQRSQISPESFVPSGELSSQDANVVRAEVVALSETKHFLQSGEDGELPREWMLAEEQIEHAELVLTLRLPVRVRHRDLIQVSQHRVHQARSGLIGILAIRTVTRGTERSRVQIGRRCRSR